MKVIENENDVETWQQCAPQDGDPPHTQPYKINNFSKVKKVKWGLQSFLEQGKQ